MFGTRTKHGNFNTWMADLASKGISYDLLLGVDTDQVPLANFAERLVGYFRDPDVAFVVGPQVYGNYHRGRVPRWAESQASFFQAVIQRAGNCHGTSMFVGTNYAVRWSALHQIGGFQPCITEDMATGLSIHAARNPQTHRKWRSVYTPDVLAIGEGPQSWTDYNNQQWRWAAGSFDTWKRLVWRTLPRLRPGAFLHYLLVLLYYPTTAINWFLSALSSTLYLVFSASAVHVPISRWITLYGCSGVLQMSLYFWNRRHNVSPHEPEGSYGFTGMVMSALTAPIYLSAFVGVLIGRRAKFVVTAKGENVNPDRIWTFRKHLPWSLILTGALVYAICVGHTHPAMVTWAAIGLTLSLLPLILSRFNTSRASSEPSE
jgi:cellulose synthase/poly-beta-1,6-N-acetylglucosamine synthase-like glycosyltransferase